jgi:hypothetical protein
MLGNPNSVVENLRFFSVTSFWASGHSSGPVTGSSAIAVFLQAVQLYRKASRHTEAWLSLGRAFGDLQRVLRRVQGASHFLWSHWVGLFLFIFCIFFIFSLIVVHDASLRVQGHVWAILGLMPVTPCCCRPRVHSFIDDNKKSTVMSKPTRSSRGVAQKTLALVFQTKYAVRKKHSFV